MTHSRPLRRRGTTLIEGLISTTVLIIGIVGAFQGILQASTQNTVASRIARATAMATQARISLERQTLARLTAGTGVLGNGACVAPTAAHVALTDQLAGMAEVTCVVDLDIADADPTLTPNNKIFAKYDFANDYTNGSFRRLLVYMRAAVPADPSLPRNPDVVAVVVSVKEGGRRVFVKQFASFFNANTGVEL
jgi:hypothetical protein